MKTLWLSAVTLVTAAFLAQAAAPSGALQVGKVRGEAQLLRGGQPIPLKAGATIRTGDVVITGGQGEARLMLTEPAGELILSPGTELRIDQFDSKDTGIEPILDVAITLIKGDLHGGIGKLSDLSKFEITLGNCRHQVGVGKTTRFALSADGTLRVRNGCITSLCQGGAGYSVCAGEKYVPKLGLVVAMTAPELTSPIWDIAALDTKQGGQNPPPENPPPYVNPLIGASISPSGPPAP